MKMEEWRFMWAFVLCTLRPYTAQEGFGRLTRTYSFSLMDDGDVVSASSLTAVVVVEAARVGGEGVGGVG